MEAPSILSAVQKMRALITRDEKLKWLGMIGFAFCSSVLEVVTASIIVIFAQVLNQPEIGLKYLSKIGVSNDLSARHILCYLAILVGLVYLIKNMIAAGEIFYQNFSIQKMNFNFKNKLLYRYAESDYGFYLTRNSALGMQIVSNDVEQMFTVGMVSLANILSEGIIFLCLITMIVYINPSLALTVFAIGTITSFYILKILLPKFYNYGQKLQQADLYSNQNLIQFFHGFKEIILFGKRDNFIHNYQLHSHKKAQTQAISASINAIPRLVIEIIFVGLFVMTIAILCLRHEGSPQIVGTLGGYLYVGFRLMPALNRIINLLSTFKSVIPSIERVYDEYHACVATEQYLNKDTFKFEHKLVIDKFYFKYLNTDYYALEDINIEIKKGECLGIIGETGSGKSTLVDTILGLLQSSQGTMLVDNKYPVNCYQWHRQIGYVPQNVYLTDDTIEANIAFGEKVADPVKLQQAIDAAQLTKFIEKLQNGVKTVVGERGVRLSGGERQRIAIARALYRSPQVLIFDEATSALDNETEARLMDTIDAISQNRTVVMIAHRLTTLKNCDRIVVMEKGRIKEITAYNNLNHMKVIDHA